MKLFLTSSFQNTITLLNAFLRDHSAEDVLVIPTAGNVERESDGGAHAVKLFSSMGLRCTAMDIAAYTRRDILEAIDQCNCLAITGGNTFYLMQELKKKALMRTLREKIAMGMLYLGESAGAVLAGKDISYIAPMDDPTLAPELRETKALSVFSPGILPHCGPGPQEECAKAILNSCGDELLSISNHQAIIVENGEYSIETEPFNAIRDHMLTFDPTGSRQEFVRAEGASLFDTQGREYLNLNEISMPLGFAHPVFTECVAKYASSRMLVHAGNYSCYKEELLKKLMAATHNDFQKFFMASSGGEVVDWSIKIARRATGRDGIVRYRNALHGRSFAGAFISETPLRKEGFGSGLQNIYTLDYPADGRSSDRALSSFPDIAGIIIEPFQAAGAMASPSPEYWQWLRTYTRERGILLIMDEIQTGFGKTGSLFAYEESGIVPDILLLGKGMSNGFGLGGMLLSETVAAHIPPNTMSGGSADNDFMCSIVSLVLDILQSEKLPAHARQLGTGFVEKLSSALAVRSIPHRFTGRGLFLGLELPEGMAEKAQWYCNQNGILLGRSGQVLTLRAPLTVSETELSRTADTILSALE